MLRLAVLVAGLGLAVGYDDRYALRGADRGDAYGAGDGYGDGYGGGDGDAGGRGSPEKRRPHRKVTKPKVAGRAHESPRPPPLDDAKFDPGEPELKSISQWWPVDTELSPFVAAPKVSESLSL